MIIMYLRSIIPALRSAYLITVMLLAVACTAAPTPAIPTSTAVPTPAPTRTPEPEVDAFTMNKRLSHTVNLANALEAPKEGDWG
jgi:hypothetical protein